MRRAGAIFAALLISTSWDGAGLATQTCADPAAALGVSRIVEIDTSTGPIYGDMTRRAAEPTFLEPKEVVLTFDDGPVPWITTPILDTLDKFCTKATFFSVGEMALAYPATAKDIMARGHTLGTHTWSHPLNLRSLGVEKATGQIERGFAAVALAAGQPIAPFFRFPGLSDSDALLSHLQTRGIASFTVDVISNDSYIPSANLIAERVIRETEIRQGGILLFHDIKPATAKALPRILTELKARGFKIVHMRAKAPLTPVANFDAENQAVLAKAGKKEQLLPFYGAVAPTLTDGSEPPVSPLASAARQRTVDPVVATPSQDAEPHKRASRAHRHRSRRPAQAKAL
jgi:peptidoglycan/xylan/chitin deacetylase (PgdA/CDA1 family)